MDLAVISFVQNTDIYNNRLWTNAISISIDLTKVHLKNVNSFYVG